MEFELFELSNDLLALDTEYPAPQLLDDQLQVFDLLVAGTQFLDLFRQRLALLGEYLTLFDECLLLLLQLAML